MPYLQATDESERQEHLDELLLVYAAPVVRHLLRLKLGFRVNPFGVNPHNQDAEDLYQETGRSLEPQDQVKWSWNWSHYGFRRCRMQNLRITKKRARVSNAQTFHIIRDGLFYKIEN